MMKDFTYTFNSIKKCIGFDLTKKNYTKEEVIDLLKIVCVPINHIIDDLVGYDIEKEFSNG